ncbi:Phosphofurin acidic cluster sorting protein 2 [Eumeta japonica]|uniref:Phosphofurin acidic cluster sorting protein 2 n=1 Tax=Eumeta variegata TaxID=151549 RepID=A0A4C1XYC8_EUMVA|nr:Phosphofurin acidic cluster sorting protein 2 [Eumeta japonica]
MCVRGRTVTRHASLASARELPASARERAAQSAVSTTHAPESEGIRNSAGDERGSEGNSDGDVTADAPVSGASVSSSPPKDHKEEKRSRLFRSATSGGNLTPASGSAAGGRKKNSLVISEPRPLSTHDLPTQSPTTLEPSRTALELINRALGEEGAVPEVVALVCGGAAQGAGALSALGVPTIPAPHPPDARPLLQTLYARLNKHGGRRGVRVVVCGGDALVAAAVRAHAELAARRPIDAPPTRFYIVPFGSSTVGRHLAATDPGYAALFAGEGWAALNDRGADPSLTDVAEISSRIARYLSSTGPTSNLPIGEAMIAYRDKSADEDSSQTFAPFIAEVRLGCSEAGVSSLELEEGGSPPARPSPPATPAPPAAPIPAPDVATSLFKTQEPLELQLDYWLVSGRTAEAGDSKVTVKAYFRALHVTRQNAHLCVTYLTKEKKQKIMRLGKKKEKTGEAEVGRAQTVEGVARLICSAKGSHGLPLKVYIDGTEWNGVKFFQLSTQWQTHVKTFPVATIGAPLAPPET